MKNPPSPGSLNDTQAVGQAADDALFVEPEAPPEAPPPKEADIYAQLCHPFEFTYELEGHTFACTPPAVRPGSVWLSCQLCGCAFNRWPAEIRRGQDRYCTRACQNEALRCQPTLLDLALTALSQAVRDRQPVMTWQQTPCVEWPHSRHHEGYGTFHKTGAPDHLVHRAVWRCLNGGRVPAGYDVLHHCDNPPCYEPTHLFAGLHVDNMADMVSKHRGRPRGTTPPTVEQRLAIARALLDGTRPLVLAGELGLSSSTIRRIARAARTNS